MKCCNHNLPMHILDSYIDSSLGSILKKSISRPGLQGRNSIINIIPQSVTHNWNNNQCETFIKICLNLDVNPHINNVILGKRENKKIDISFK